LHRIYDPTDHGATATGFRLAGPFGRFDHHISGTSSRGIVYAAPTYEGCIVEVSDDLVLDIGERRHVLLEVLQDVRVLDLRRNGAMLAGIDARIGKCDHDDSQPWARYFYEDAQYNSPFGLIWLNSHNDAEALAFFERTGAAFRVQSDVRMAEELAVIATITEACGITINFASLP
jgi:hypothetical protein